MKRAALVLLVFVFALNVFSQTKSPVEVANEFWNLALKNDFEGAKKLTETKSFEGIKREALKIDFQTVSKKGFGKLKLIRQEILPATAKLHFSSQGSFENALVEISLVKSLTDWKVKSFDVKFVHNFRVYGNYVNTPPMQNYQPSPQQFTLQYSPFSCPPKSNEAQILPLEPYNPQKNPAKIIAEPYSPQKTPVCSFPANQKNP